MAGVGCCARSGGQIEESQLVGFRTDEKRSVVSHDPASILSFVPVVAGARFCSRLLLCACRSRLEFRGYLAVAFPRFGVALESPPAQRPALRCTRRASAC